MRTLRGATALDLERIGDLLAAAELPSEGVSDHLDDFLVVEVDGAIAGAGGLERYGRVGLLRSVVVHPAHRGRGYGRQLCRALVARAAERGVEELHLLTVSAARFFTGLGFAPIERSLAPEAIRATREFSALCPDSAVFMRRSVSAIPAARSGDATREPAG